jgi:hypothetical protein
VAYWSDEELGMGRSITRRDFLDGVAIAVGAAPMRVPQARHDVPGRP